MQPPLQLPRRQPQLPRRQPLLPHLASRLYGTPLLIARPKLEIILAVLGDRSGYAPPQVAQIATAPAVAAPAAAPQVVAVIPIYGTLVRRSLGLDAASGLTSYGDIDAALQAAVQDPTITGILLDVDSSGGEVGGVFELAAHIRAANEIKPVWAVAADSAYSAAYALACSASRLVVTRTAGVGSIGVIAMHVDQSIRDAQEGLRYTAITAGARKDDFSSHGPLSNEATARLQFEVDRLYGIFVAHVAAMRGVDESLVRSTDAGLFFGSEAIEAGLADGEASGGLDAVLDEFNDYLTSRRSPLAAFPLLSLSNLQENLVMHTPQSLPDLAEPLIEPPTATTDTSPADDVAAQVAAPQVPQATTAAAPAALAIAELCQLAGHPERTVAFLAAGASEVEVRRALLADRAASTEITSFIHPDAQASLTDHNPLMKAVKKLSGKE